MNTIDERRLDPKRDWCFFDKDTPVPMDCLADIRPLTEESARAIWCEFVDSDPRHDHPMGLPGTSWPVQLLSSSVSESWQEDWNDGDAIFFATWLQHTISWPGDTPVIFTSSCAESVATTWRVFWRCWRNFLFDDEGSFIWSLQQPDAIRFMPSGVAYAGRRYEPMA